MNRLVLRGATPQDRAFVERVYFEMQRWLIAKLFGWRGDEAERSKFAAFYDERNTQIVQCDGEDVGWLTVVRQPDRIELDSIYILSSWQNRGLGTALLERLITESNAARKILTLGTGKINPARYLYERLGFVAVHQSEFKVYMERQPTSQ